MWGEGGILTLLSIPKPTWCSRVVVILFIVELTLIYWKQLMCDLEQTPAFISDIYEFDYYYCQQIPLRCENLF